MTSQHFIILRSRPLMTFPTFHIKLGVRDKKTGTVMRVHYNSSEYRVSAPTGVWYHMAIVAEKGELKIAQFHSLLTKNANILE